MRDRKDRICGQKYVSNTTIANIDASSNMAINLSGCSTLVRIKNKRFRLFPAANQDVINIGG